MSGNYILLRRLLKIFIPALLTIVLYIIAIFVIILPNIEQGFIERKKEMTKRLVESQWHILEYYHSLEKQGIRTRQQAQERAKALFHEIRYGHEKLDYFWVNDFQCRMISHPYRPDLENKDLSTLADPNGKFLVAEFVNTVMKDCEGYVDYIWQWHADEAKLAHKLSFVKGFWPWGWIIGTGVYIEDVQTEVNQFIKKIVKFSAVILAIVTSLSILIVVQSSISDRKRIITEENLAKSHAEYKSLVEHINLGVFRTTVEGEGRFIKVNTAMARIFGYDSVEELMSITPACLYEDLKDRDIFLSEIACSKRIKNKELRLKKKDGTLFWALLSLTITTDAHGNTTFIDGVLEDITEHKKMTAEKEELLKTLARKNEELESIIYVSSHDLRTPLINIQGFRSELEKSCAFLKQLIDEVKIQGKSKELIEPVVQNDIPRALHHIRMGISKIGNLIDGLLTLSKVSSVKQTQNVIDVHTLIRDIIQNKQPILAEKRASVVIDVLPPCKGNLSALKDVFSNIIDNAIHFRHPERPLKVHIYGQTDDARVIYCIEDNGIGIKPEYQQKIFNIFHKLQPHDSSAGEGLGLTVAKRILDRLDGTIWLESEYGQFTRFYVSLPAYKTDIQS